jgi:hypothetical protein
VTDYPDAQTCITTARLAMFMIAMHEAAAKVDGDAMLAIRTLRQAAPIHKAACDPSKRSEYQRAIKTIVDGAELEYERAEALFMLPATVHRFCVCESGELFAELMLGELAAVQEASEPEEISLS